jgi:succinate-semialdehyde dehydrogenase/glutarate-semialdehyde dehydrogenase
MSKLPFQKEQCFIGGRWRDADDGQTLSVTNPATGETIGAVPRCGRAEAAAAIEAAHAAFPAWRRKTAAERAKLMHKLCDLMDRHQDDLARLLTIEMGKSLAEAKGELTIGAGYIRWFAEEGKRLYGDTIPSPWADRRILVTKEPIGVVGSITPWNFPNSMITRKLGPALAAGCPIVIKPASQTPFSALAMGVLAEEAGVPAGVINILTGSAADIAKEFCENPKLRKVTFTGSTEVGKRLASDAMAHMKHVSMELGGNAPFIVFDDADLDKAVEGAMASKFRNSGQTCVCANRILVHAPVYDAFAEKFAAAIKTLKVGDGLEEGVTQGPLIDVKGVEKVEAHIEDAVSKGAKVMLGGRRHALGHSFFEPTLLTDVTADMVVAREETFGPLAPLFRFDTEEQAIRMANDTEFGLAAYFYTQGLGRAHRVMEGLEYGIIGVNEGVVTTEVAPFGGYKESGVGREGSKYGIEDYLEIKYACFGGLGL